MHAQISIGYSADAAIKKLDPARYKTLSEKCPWLDLPVPQPATEDEWKAAKWNYYSICYQVIDLETCGRVLADCEIPFEIHKFKNTYHVADHEHTHIHCHIPNVGLLMIDDVTYEEDCCTNRLQSLLDDGWRILAVCPPNAQRRPDYILGRSQDLREKHEAKR